MTGEINLSGGLLPVSGVRDKILAAQRAGMRVVVLPQQNEVDVGSVDAEAREGLEIVLADDTVESWTWCWLNRIEILTSYQCKDVFNPCRNLLIV